MPRFSSLSLILAAALMMPLAGCSGKDTARHTASRIEAYDASAFDSVPHGVTWREIWDSLSARLQRDGVDAKKTQELFDRLNTPRTLIPMGAKIKELYTAQFLPRPAVKRSSPAKPRPKSQLELRLGVSGPWYKDVVTRANAQTCLDFIRTHCAAFRQAQCLYGVAPEIGAALLFVETRHGRMLGRENAFYSLASMAVTRSPETIAAYLDDLPGIHARTRWVRMRMDEKADWAYAELKALLEYCFANGIDPYAIPGSIYGAIGMCQFMPSNLKPYAADGDSDGIINIFQAPDAIASLNRYLNKHGWKRDMDLRQQERVLMRYNKSTAYARTILALARYIVLLEKPHPAKTAASKVKAAQASPAKTKARAPRKTSAKSSRKATVRQTRKAPAKARSQTKATPI